MDDGLDMELFGDGVSLAPPLMPVAKGLLQRIEELRVGGCCQKLCWSNLGCIAYITDEDQGISVRNLYCDSEDGSWSLSKVFPVPQVQMIHGGQPLAHISWNHTGGELAIVDLLGRLSIFSIVIAMNRLTSSRSGLMDHPDDFGAIVGLKWLNHDRLYPVHRPAVRREGKFEYSMLQQRPLGPLHPLHGKSAVVCVTRGGVVRLVFQTQEAGWAEARTELESISSSDNVLSHASLCSDQDNTLLVTARSVSYGLRLYRLEINWNMASNQKTPPSPVITVHHLKILFPPLRQVTSSVLDINNAEVAPSELTHLEMIPVASQTEDEKSSFTTILAVYSSLPRLDDPESEAPLSCILRYELVSGPQRLHPSFEQLASKKSSTGVADQKMLELKQRDGITVSKTILSVQAVQDDNLYMMTYSDGSVEFRDRSTMDVISSNEDFDTVHSMIHTGMTMPPDETCLHLCVSPNFCYAIALDAEGTARLKTMQHGLGEVGHSVDEARYSSLVTALAMQFVYSFAQHNSSDDLTALVRQLAVPNLAHEFLGEIYRAMNMNVDYSHEPQHEKLFRNPMIQRLLSVQNALNYQGEKKHRSLHAKLAWFTLHLRLVALTFAFSFNSGNKATGERASTEAEFQKPEVLHTFLGIVRYFVDFINFLIDELFELANFLRGQRFSLQLLQERLVTANTPALPLLLSSMPRTLIRYNARGVSVLRSMLGRMFDPSNPARASLNEPLMKTSVTALITTIEKSPVKMTEFERFINEVDGSIKEAYAATETSELARRQMEKTLLTSATIAPNMQPAIAKMLGPLLGGMRSAVNPAELYFADYSWLGLSDDKRTDEWARTHLVDAMRKVELPKGTTLRRCVRCCAQMEDVKPYKGRSMWMSNMQKMCLCGSLWMLTDGSEKE